MRKIGNYLFVEKQDDIYTIRMTPELQDDVGTVAFVEYNFEDKLKKGDFILFLEASKTVIELKTPISGTVHAKNEASVDQPNLLNSADEAENWLIQLTDVDEAEFAALEDE